MKINETVNDVVRVVDTTENVSCYRATNGYSSIRVKHCVSNCKLTYLNNVTDFLYNLNEDTKKHFDQVLRQCRIVVYLNVTNIPVKEWIEKNYELYSCVQIPVGYDNGYQYHMYIRNKIGIPNPTMRPTEYKLYDSDGTKKESLFKLFKSKRRKTDIIDNILEIVK